MKPLEALDKAIFRGYFHDYISKKPGAVIEKLPAQDREALSKLTSDDLATLRPDACKY